MTDETPKQQECPPPRTREAVDCWLRRWGRGDVVEGKEPLTRNDVERLIEANGGTAKDLDLSRRNVRGIDLHEMNLSCAKLQGADLRHATLDGANFEGPGAGQQTDMEGVKLFGARVTDRTELRRVQWGKKVILGDESGMGAREDKKWGECVEVYRTLKHWYQRIGDNDTAGRFYYRELECQRKQVWQEWREIFRRSLETVKKFREVARRSWEVVKYCGYEQLFGYGERPWRVVRAAVVIILGLAVAYYLLGSFVDPIRFLDALYFSAVSFSALGYGGWAPNPEGWARYMGVAESFLGVFTIALFLVTFTRKMVR
ncbi:MAG: pentapeptide repeat-containing protein [Chloroflexi bacterium]|nr:pentapeptide repeat-containing protein [Chloroflexota bacterium]